MANLFRSLSAGFALLAATACGAETDSIDLTPQQPALTICASGPRDNCVHDGDTFWLDGAKIRVLDIDTPELNSQCATERVGAIHARDRLLELLNAGPFQLVAEGRDRDRNGRLLRKVMRDGQSLGDQLVDEGVARAWTGRRQSWC